MHLCVMEMKTCLKYLCVLLVLLAGCERDDICAEETPTTPQLILRFYSLADPDTIDPVPDLYAYGLDDDDNPVEFLGVIASTKDSIAIPLRTNVDQTRFVLHQNFDIDDNGTPGDPTDDIVLGNPDIVTLNYLHEDVHVSRACGFKTIFNSIAFSVDIDGDNWIINSDILEENVENEFQAHVKVLH